MDYCSTCRRHLNGALVCPGCGAYAPDIAPGVVGSRAVPAAVAPAAADAGVPAIHRDGGTAVAAAGTDALPSAEVPHAIPAPVDTGTGRAARRRQQVRWKKTQRRALVATAVALVGGGLTLVSMDRGNGDRTQAAAAPDLKGMGGAKGPADEYGDPGSPAPAPDRASQPPSAGDGRHRPADDAPAATTPSDTRTDGVTASRAAAGSRPAITAPDTGSGARPDTTADTATGADSGSRADGPDTATRPAPPPPVADDSDGTGADTGTDQGASEPAPTTPPAASPESPRSPDKLCLLVICLGS
ncbi:hypothetical protein [Streptomyces sp. NPDC016626]|uniref:SCO2400 family protein n=1 Tax=Streptomyces sp. NPDC016626 TaxID=3364968 RepID=UPI0036F9EB2D